MPPKSSTPNLPTRHNNPLNLKYGGLTKKYIESGEAELGEKARDGGRFLKFKTPEFGMAAAKDVLFGSKLYRDLDVDSALKKWSNSGYGAEVAPDVEPTTKIDQLTENERDHIVSNMAKREGFGAELEDVDEPEVTMPGKLKKYRVTNKKTGESIEAQFAKPPSQEEIGRIFETRKTHQRQREISEATERERPFTARLADVLFAPSEAVAPEVLPPEEIEKLPTTTRVKRLGQEVVSGLISPEGLATTLPAFTGPLGLAASGIAGAAQMAPGVPETLRQAFERPSIETVGRAGITGLGLASAGVGTRIGIKQGMASKATPKVTPPVTRIKPKGLLEENIPIEAEFIERPFEVPGRERARITGEVPPEEPLQIGPGTPQIPKRVEKPVRGEGFTMNAPKEIVPTTERPIEVLPPESVSNISDVIKYGGEGEGGRLISEQTGFELNKKGTSILTAKRATATGPEKAAIDNILIRRGVLPDPNETFVLEKPVPPPSPVEKTIATKLPTPRSRVVEGEVPFGSPLRTEKGAYLTSGDETIFVPEEDIKPMLEKGFKETMERRKKGVKREFPFERRQIKEEGEGILRIEKPIENKWLMEQETSVLESLREGSSGQMRTEIDQVLGERGIKQEIRTTPSKILEEAPAPILDEVKFEEYNSNLEDLISLDTVQSETLRNIAQRGKDAGLDLDTVVNDMIENMPRINNASNRAYQAANRIFRTGEAGFGSIDFLIGRAGRKAKGTEAEGPINEARNQVSFFEKYFTKPERVIGRMGEHGQKLERMIEDAQYEADALKGKVDILAHDAFKGLTPREAGQRIAVMKDGKEIPLNRGNMDKYVNWEKGVFKPKPGVQKIVRSRGSLSDVILDNAQPMNEKVALAAQKLRAALDVLGTEGESSGVSTITTNGKRIPFQKIGQEYWPRDYTEGFYKSLDADPTSWNKIIKDVADSKNISLKEAENLLKNKKTFSEVTTRGQHQRTFKQDSFVIDPEAIFDHINSFSGRVGMSKAFGPEDILGSKVNNELTALMNEGWDQKFASDTISNLVGRESTKDRPAPGEASIYKAITSINNARLMTSFVINNLGGITPMVARAGEINTLKGIGAYLGNLEVARRMATISGARASGIIEQGGNFVGRMLGIPASERFIRTWADQTGRVTANQLVEHLNEVKTSSPEFIRGKKFLDSILGKDSTEVIQRGVLTPDELARAGWQMAKDTEGLVNPGTFPEVWQKMSENIVVNLAMQYKRMAAQSMGSLIESFQTNPTRALRAILVTGPIIGEVIGSAGSALFGGLAGTMTGEGAVKAAIRDVEDRGKSLANAAKPILQKKMGLTEGQANLVGRYIDDMNRGFALGLLGDIIYSTAYWGGQAGSEIAAGGIAPAFELAFDISKSIMNNGKDMIYNFIPQRIGSSYKRSERAMKGQGAPLVRPPRIPSL